MTYKIYTKKGDRGETSLVGGKRVSKADLRVEAYGDVDELNAMLGCVRQNHPSEPGPIDDALCRLQSLLFELGGQLATPDDKTKRSSGILPADINWLEELIDAAEVDLEPLRAFVLPSGCPLGVSLHVARTVCRRAERHVVALDHANVVVDNVCVIFLNRLSDLLFVWSRLANQQAGVQEVQWQPRAES